MNNTSSVTVHRKEDEHYLNFYTRFLFLVLDPVGISLGIFGNAIILIIMPKKVVKVAPMMKFYYCSIALGDFVLILVGWLLWVILADTLYVLTDGEFAINLVNWNAYTCKGMVFGWVTAEIYSNYAVSAMTIERLIALYFPLKAKAIITKKFSITILVLLLIPPMCALVPLIPIVSNIEYEPGASASGQHCSRDKSHPLYGYYALTFTIVVHVAHLPLNQLLGFLLLIGIIRSTLSRKKLIQDQSNTSKAINTSMIIFMVLVVNTALYFPTCVMSIFYYTIKVEDPELKVALGNWFRFFGDSIVYAHALNYFIYLWRIQTFRRANNALFCCKGMQSVVSS